MAHDKRTRQELLEQIARLKEELARRKCECHKPKNAARPPHENTMAGRK